MSSAKAMICPFCGHAQEAASRCESCRVPVDPLTRQATQNEMGPWSVRDPLRPHFPGCSYEMMGRLVSMGVIGKYTVVRGPSTQQFWVAARRAPGIAHLLGYCHSCDAKVPPGSVRCPDCGEEFGAWLDRERLGLAPIRGLPGDPDHEIAPRRKTGHTISAFAPDTEIAAGTRPPAPSVAPETAAPTAERKPSPREITLAQELDAARSRARRLAVVAVALGLVALAAILVVLASRLSQPAGGG